MSSRSHLNNINEQYVSRILRNDKYKFGHILGTGEFGCSVKLTCNVQNYVGKIINIPSSVRQKGAEDKYKKIIDDLNEINTRDKSVEFSINKEENVIIIMNNFYENGSIDKYLRLNCGKYNDELIIISIIYQTLIILNDMHSHHQLHFNLKPRNIYFNSDFKLVFDFPGIGFNSDGISVLSNHQYSKRYKIHSKLINKDSKLYDLWPLFCIFLDLIFGKISFNHALLKVLDYENINLRFSSQSYYSQELKDFIFIYFSTMFNNEKLKSNDCMNSLLNHELFKKLNRPHQVLSLNDIDNSKDLLAHIKTHYPFIFLNNLPKLAKLNFLMDHERMKPIRGQKKVYSSLYGWFESLINGEDVDIIFDFKLPDSWEFWMHMSVIFYLLKDTKLIHLELRRCSITPKTIGILCDVISYLTQLRTDFTLGSNQLTGAGKVIAGTFKHLKSLEALYLWSNQLDKESLMCIISEIHALTLLNILDLSNEKFDEDIIRHLSIQFQYISHLKELFLYGDQLEDNLCGIFMGHIKYLPSLEKLDLHENKLTNGSLQYFAQNLKYVTQLDALILADNLVTPEGIEQGPIRNFAQSIKL